MVLHSLHCQTHACAVSQRLSRCFAPWRCRSASGFNRCVPQTRCSSFFRYRSFSHRLVAQAVGPGSSTGLSPELRAALDKFVNESKVVVFMKGTKLFPQCGFSNTVVQILNSLNVPYETVNILENELVRSGMKEYSQWPTFPQVYIDGEFFGGCDIMTEAYQSGELQESLEKALNS